MKIVILGSNGFLGQYVSKYLKNYDLIKLTRKDLNLCNFLDVQKWLIKHKPDVVINCAIAGGTRSNIHSQNINDLQNNISIFLNFFNNSNYFNKFINVGSGAEFDISKNINNAKEEDIFISNPTESYGYSKNIISRLSREKSNFYTLRLFGCFDSSEPDYRLFKKLLNSEKLIINDRKFDYISAEDFCKILEFYINENNLIKDINCVYQKKVWLSDILYKFNKQIIYKDDNLLNYTGNPEKLKSLNIKLNGLEKEIQKYIKEVTNDSL